MKKVLACLLMVIHHIGLYYSDRLPENVSLCLQFIGSLALPIFAYSLATGFLRTRNISLYFLRILGCFTLTQAVLVLVLPLSGQSSRIYPINDCFILVLGFIVLYAYELMLAVRPGDRIVSLRLIEAAADTNSDRFDVRIGSGDTGRLPVIPLPPFSAGGLFFSSVLLIFTSLVLSLTLPLEKGLFGILIVSVFYILERFKPQKNVYQVILWFLLLGILDMIIVYLCTKQISTNSLALPAVLLCLIPSRAKKPGRIIQYGFYLFYPVHILVLLLLRAII